MWPYLLQGLALGLAAAVQPGPFMTYLISQTLSRGFRRAWVAALAPLLSDGPIIAFSLLVLSQLPGWLQQALNLAGGLFILYLAWGAYRQWRQFSSVTGSPPPGARNLFQAALINAVSPMPYIYWSLVTGPILIAGWRESPSYGIGFIVAFYVVMLGGFLSLMAVFEVARGLGERISRALLGLAALALAVFGLFQLWRGLLGSGG